MLILAAAVPAAAGLSACSSAQARVALKRAHLVSARAFYVEAAAFKTADFPPPPVPGSREQEEDKAAVLQWQARRSAADCEGANLTAKADYDFFWAGRKSPFPEPFPRAAKSFIARLASDLDSAVTVMKDRYARPRPYQAYPGEAKPCVKKSWGYSYPSGHSTYSRVYARVLADILPERREEFLATADRIALDRVVGGVHFPTDIEAGKAFGDLYHAELRKSPAYLADVEMMKGLLAR